MIPQIPKDVTKSVRSTLLTSPTRQWGAIIFMWALCVSILFNLLVVGPHEIPVGDEVDYDDIAVHILEDQRYVNDQGGFWPAARSDRPPLFPLYLASVYAVFGVGNYLAARIGLSIIGALLCVVLFLLADRAFDRKSGIVTGLVAAVYPYLVYFTGYLRPELPYLLLVYLGLLEALEFLQKQKAVYGFITGLCWGLAALARNEWLGIVPFFILWWGLFLERGRRGFLRASYVAVIMIATMAPWTIRNYLVHNAFVPTSTRAGLILAGSNNPVVLRDPIMRGFTVQPREYADDIPDVSWSSEVEYDRVLRRYALTFVKDHPRDALVLAFWRLIRQWHLYYPITNRTFPELMGLLTYFVVAILAFVGAVKGAAQHKARSLLLFTLLLFVFTNAVAVFVIAGTRYRLLIEPAFIILAGHAIVQALTGTPRCASSDYSDTM